MTRSTKPVSIQCLLSETSYIDLREDPRSHVANTGIEGAREEDRRRKPRSADSSPTNIRTTLQNTKATPKKGVRKRKASEMTDEADPAAPPPLVASVPLTEAPSSCDPDLPSRHHLEDEDLLNPTTSYCFSGLFLTPDTDI
ncbi:hypothetical protein FGLOB1_4167 [Fusarium globosum]|uniref:Uncharacterized protein n=1 Tax=Fusarium globosum TaxID=78864 RepID=A0A8H6DDS4_9HYPO|nr:hypothetical protein FGLOB1_4167 [Fusarium globosum]